MSRNSKLDNSYHSSDINNKFNEMSLETGFSLASGKTLLVSKESILKAQNMFNNQTGNALEQNNFKNPIFQKIKPGLDTEFAFDINEKSSPSSDESICKTQNAFSNSDDNFSEPINSQNNNLNEKHTGCGTGFSFASEKKDPSSSDNSKTQVFSFLGDSYDSFDYDEFMSNKYDETNTETIGFSLASGKKAPPISDEAKLRAQNLLCNSNVNFNQTGAAGPVGFSLASGKKAPPVSEESRRRAQNLFGNPNDSFNEQKNGVFIETKTEAPAGFSFASGKKVPPVSEESKRRAQNLLGNPNDSFNEQNSGVFIETKTEAPVGFSFASGKKVPPVSTEAKQRAQNLLGNSNDFYYGQNDSELTEPKTAAPVGFSLASGKKAPPVSEEAKRRAQNLLGNSNDSFNEPKSSEFIETKTAAPTGFSFASGKKVPPVSEEAKRRAQNLLGNSNDSFNEQNSVEFIEAKTTSPAGFSLASGKKPPPISEDARRRAQSLLSNDPFYESSDDEFIVSKTAAPVGFSLASGKKAPPVSEEARRRAQNLLGNSLEGSETNNQSNAAPVGFSFASGKKPPPISEEAKRRAQSLLRNDPFYESSDDEFIVSKTAAPVGFSLASGKKPPPVSEEAKRRAQNLLGNSDNSNLEQDRSEFTSTAAPAGFSFASGKKPPPVSEEARRRAQNLLCNSDESFIESSHNDFNENNAQAPAGFSFASGKKAPPVSEEAKRRAQNLFNNSDNSYLEQDRSEFTSTAAPAGFSFASGKKAPPVSEEARRRAQNLLSDPNDGSFITSTTSKSKEERKFLSAHDSYEEDEDESTGIPSILSTPTPPTSQECNSFTSSSGSLHSYNSPVFPHPPSIVQNNQQQTSSNSRLSSPFTSSMTLKVHPSSGSNWSQNSKSTSSGLLTPSASPSVQKLSPATMALHRAAGISPMRIIAQQNQAQQTPGRFTSMISKGMNRNLPPSLPFTEEEHSSYPQSMKYQQRTVSIASTTPQQYPATPQAEIRTNNALMRQPQSKPKSKQFKPPKQINNNLNQIAEKQAAAASSAQSKRDEKPFFELDKVLRIDPNQDQQTPETSPIKNKYIERYTLNKYGLIYGVPKHNDQPFLPKDAENYRFEDGRGSADMFVSLVESGFDLLLLKPKWVRNHYKWIVWKLKNIDLCYPDRPHLLCYINVLNELKYRAQVEILDARRSCLRLIYERDHLNNACMVLMVSDILPREAEGDMIELSDGWYSMATRIDPYLAELVKNGQIKIGTKLQICNATIDGETASEPLEDKKDTRLIIRINSVRRARWDKQLGYQKVPLFPVSLSSLFPKGGPLPFIEVVIQRKYPFLYKENMKQQEEADKDKNGNSPSFSIVRNQEQQSRYEQKHEQSLSEAIAGLTDQWQKDLEEEGTDASNSSPLLVQCLKSSDQEAFISSIQNEESRKELRTLIEKHRQQSDEFIRMKVDDYIRDNTSEFTTFFSLLVTDMCPNNHKDAEITFWRAPLDLYEELSEGMTVRIYQLETSDTRADRLSSRGSPRFEQVEIKQSKTIFRKRTFLNTFSDILTFSNEMNLPVGTEFDFVCLVLKIDNDKLYVCDGTPIIASIELKVSPDNNSNSENSYAKYSCVCVENAKFVGFDSNSGVANFSAYDTTVITRKKNIRNKKVFVAFQKLQELTNFDYLEERIDQLIRGEFVSYSRPAFLNLSPSSFMSTKNSLVCSICDFDKIDFVLYNSSNDSNDNSNNTNLYNGNDGDKASINDDKLVYFFGTPFTTSNWKSRYIESHPEIDRGLNIVVNVTDGIGCRFVHINKQKINRFFKVVGVAARKNQMVDKVEMFYEKYFNCSFNSSESWLKMKEQRFAMKEKYKLNLKDVEAMLRATFLHMELIYNINESVESMMKSADLILPFDENEWISFQKLLRGVLVGIEMQIELYDDGNLFDERVSIVSTISSPSIEDRVRQLMESFM